MTTTANNGRIQAVDALRGFAVMGIILLHNIEHFNFYSFPETTGALQALDGTIWDFLFFSFSGKAYAIFALLFGFTFYLQSRSSNRRGEDFKNRYMWRLVLLLLFGFINASFFPGEILVLYAILGFVLVPVRHISDRALFITLAILMLQPLEWAKVAYAAVNPAANPEQMIFSLADVYPQLEGNNFWEMVKVNFVTGQLASLNWAWCYGRVFQTCALFMLGLLLGRKGLFSSADDASLARSRRFWTRTVCISLPVAVTMYYAKQFVFSQIENPFMLASVETTLNSWYNLAFMLAMTGTFLLLFWSFNGKILNILAPYGRMSLTCYVTQSMAGSLLFYNWGFSLHDDLGITASFLVGILLFLTQYAFCYWWMKRHSHGPLEYLWKRGTWLK